MTDSQQLRFQHLIQPIRDLAKNWNIDIANDLEDYLDELENVTISFDAGNSTLNFAEAALLIQGTACIYSRKVEYLYALVYQTLEHLTQQNNNNHPNIINNEIDIDNNKENDNNEDEDDNNVLNDIDQLLPIIKNLKENKHIDIVKSESTINENEENYATNGTNYQSSVVLMSSLIPEEADNGENFKLLSSIMHDNGTLMLDENARNMVDTLDINISSNMNSNENTQINQSKIYLTQKISEDNDEFACNDTSFDNDAEALDVDNDNYNHGENSYDLMGKDPPNQSIHEDGTMSEKKMMMRSHTESSSKTKNTIDDCPVDSEEESSWKPLDPYDISKNKSLPYKKGKPYIKKRVNPKYNVANTFFNKIEKENIPVEFSFSLPNNLNHNSRNGENPSNDLENFFNKSFRHESHDGYDFNNFLFYKPFYLKEYNSLFEEFRKENEKKERKNMLMNNTYLKKRRRDDKNAEDAARAQKDDIMPYREQHSILLNEYSNKENRENDIDDEDNDDDMVEVVDEVNENGSGNMDGEIFTGDFSSDFVSDFHENNELNNINDTLFQSNDNNNGSNKETDEMSYEDLCRMHINAFMQGSEKYAKETNLSQQVSLWQNKLTPLLLEQDVHPIFDIHQCEKKIVHKLLDDTTNKTRANNNSKQKKFEEVVEGMEKYEICRMFLASLQLANNGNIELVHEETCQEQSTVSFEVNLLTTNNIYKNIQTTSV